MILIIIFSALILLMFISLVYSLVEMADDPNILTTAFGLVFTLVLLCFPLQYGIGLWRSGNTDLLEIPEPVDGIIKTSRIQISLKDYRILVLRLSFRSPIILYCIFLGVGFLVAGILSSNENQLFVFAIGIVFISFPFLSFLLAKRNYDSSKNLKEAVLYEFNLDNIIIKGESFNSTMRWSSLYKVKELNNWILLYTSKNIALCIPKSGFDSDAELQAIKSFAWNANGVKMELK